MPRTGIEIPEDLKREVKAAAAKEGKSLYQWFVEAAKEKLARRNSKQPVEEKQQEG